MKMTVVRGVFLQLKIELSRNFKYTCNVHFIPFSSVVFDNIVFYLHMCTSLTEFVTVAFLLK